MCYKNKEHDFRAIHANICMVIRIAEKTILLDVCYFIQMHEYDECIVSAGELNRWCHYDDLLYGKLYMLIWEKQREEKDKNIQVLSIALESRWFLVFVSDQIVTSSKFVINLPQLWWWINPGQNQAVFKWVLNWQCSVLWYKSFIFEALYWILNTVLCLWNSKQSQWPVMCNAKVQWPWELITLQKKNSNRRNTN